MTHALRGKIDDRLKAVEKMKTELCAACLADYNREQYEKKNQENAAEAMELGLSNLNGTEPQATWANTIRMEVYKSILPLVLAKNRSIFGKIICIPQDSDWWIERKSTPPAAVFEAINKDFPEETKPFIKQMKQNG